MALSIILAAAYVILTLYVPIIFGEAIDSIADNGVDIPAIVKYLFEAGVIAAVAAVMQWVMNVVNNRITYETVRDIRERAFKKIEALPLKYIDSHAHGDLVSRVISDVDQLADGLLLGFSQFFTGVVTIVATLCFMFSISWKITIIAVVLTPLSLFVARFVAKSTYDLFKKQSAVRGSQTALIDEMIGSQKVVKAYNYTERSHDRFKKINDDLTKVSVKAIFLSSLVNPSTRFVNAIVYAAVGLSGALSVVAGTVTVGGLTCILNYANQYTKPFNEISGVVTELQNALACASRIFELLEAEEQSPDKGLPELENVKGNVRLEGVYFSYSPDKKLIENLNLDVKPGQRIAIVGPTGCGKTTLINLLMRFYDVNAGCISVEGNDIRKITRHSLRRGYGMVLQDTWLKTGTIRENIKMGCPTATDEQMIAAAKASHAHSFIKRLPEGYDTVIGEDGGSISAGQKQLLCITRVMLAKPPMLILDEATSSIDTKTEIRVQRAFEKLMEGKTSFVVAHRLSTIMGSDLILVMRDGNIVEKGTHDELIAKGGFYSELYNSQFAH
ncbi:MAG TPA: ABC transporter ATP-binding protein [Candidatus Faeciplasma gallinarum]|uniref:ABC transporter ATP-binding protein n=1 Tax=Candidatus Faeciplasma gallinarum TaxID=2840799 RepID=A0A9D1EPR9_9FIRM|nr:ABC transporter ATP-binding protein [Candidatus Faeciplasma gallinarum]